MEKLIVEIDLTKKEFDDIDVGNFSELAGIFANLWNVYDKAVHADDIKDIIGSAGRKVGEVRVE